MRGLLKSVWLVIAVATSAVTCDNTEADTAELDPLDKCRIKSENVSLAPLDKRDYFVADYEDIGERIYVSVCHKLINLPENVRDLCDKDAHSCVTKVHIYFS